MLTHSKVLVTGDVQKRLLTNFRNLVKFVNLQISRSVSFIRQFTARGEGEWGVENEGAVNDIFEANNEVSIALRRDR